MKKKNLILLLASLVPFCLSACDPTNVSKESEQYSPHFISENSSETSSLDVKKVYRIKDCDIVKSNKDNRVYVYVSLLVGGYQPNETFEWTWFLINHKHEVVDTTVQTVTIRDYVTRPNDNNQYDFEYTLTNIKNLPDGMYQVHAGNNLNDAQDLTPRIFNYDNFDTRYRYHMGDEDEYLWIESVGYFPISEGSVVLNPSNHSGIYLKLGGPQAEEYTIDYFGPTLCDFQRIEPSYKLDPLSDYFYEVNGKNAYIYMSLAGMVAGETYMTHLTVCIDPGQQKAGKCLPLVDFNKNEHVYPIGGPDNLKFQLSYSVIKGNIPGPDEFYGALGIIVSECDIPID